MRDRTALVTGVGGPAGRAVQTYLQECGAEVIGTDMRRLEGGSRFRLLPPAQEPEFIAALLNLLDQEGVGLLVPTVTEELPKIARCRDRIRATGCAVFMCPYNATMIAGDKWQCTKALRTAAIAVPASYCGGSKEELLAEVETPVLSKPRWGRGGRGIVIHQHAGDIPDSLPPDRIFQVFLPGQEYDVNLFAEPGGRSAVSVVLKQTQLKSGVWGNALDVDRTDDREVAELAARTVHALGLEGPLDIDIRRGRDGRPAVLEVNARFGANARSAEEVLAALMNQWRESCAPESGRLVSLSSSL